MLKRGTLSKSHHRRILDRDLDEATTPLHGLAVDLGGEWRQRRGVFRPPERPDLRWLCVNLDQAVAPDIVADVACVALADACADAVICTEVLEHVSSPRAVLVEAYRLLRPHGQLIVSMPFLFPFHPDPCDYQRYTASKLERLLRDTGFAAVSIRPQGRYFVVLADMIRDGLAHARPALLRWSAALVLLPLLRLFLYIDDQAWVVRSTLLSSYTSGHFVIAQKPGHE